jgi:hypothetical protein
MSVLRPHREGVSDGGHSLLDADGRVVKHELPLGAAKTLSQLVPHYAFFTPAALYLRGGFVDAPLADLLHLVPGLKLFYRKFSHRLFDGLDAANGDKAWNFALWAVERPHYRAVEDFLVSVTLTYSQDKEVAGIGVQPLAVADALALDHRVPAAMAERVPVTAFGLHGSRVQYAFDPLSLPPRLKAFPPAKAMRAFAATLYDGGNPLSRPGDPK